MSVVVTVLLSGRRFMLIVGSFLPMLPTWFLLGVFLLVLLWLLQILASLSTLRPLSILLLCSWFFRQQRGGFLFLLVVGQFFWVDLFFFMRGENVKGGILLNFREFSDSFGLERLMQVVLVFLHCLVISLLGLLFSKMSKCLTFLWACSSSTHEGTSKSLDPKSKRTLKTRLTEHGTLQTPYYYSFGVPGS